MAALTYIMHANLRTYVNNVARPKPFEENEEFG